MKKEELKKNNELVVIHSFTGYNSSIKSIDYSPCTQYLLFCFLDEIKIINAENGKEEKSFIGITKKNLSDFDKKAFNFAGFSPDGKMILSNEGRETDGGSIFRIINSETGEEIISFPGHISAAKFFSFSPDGKTFLSGTGNFLSKDNSVKIWSTKTGKEIKTLSGHTGIVYSSSFLNNGKQVVSCSRDGTIRLWDVKTGKEVARFISFTDDEWVVIKQDGSYSTSVSGEKHLNVRP